MADYKEGEVVLMEEDQFLLTQSTSQVKITQIKLEFCDGIISDYIGNNQQTPTPLLQFMIKDMILSYKNYKNLAEIE